MLPKIYYLTSQLNWNAFYRTQLITSRLERSDVTTQRYKKVVSYITGNLPGCFGSLNGDSITSQIIAFLFFFFHGLFVEFLSEELKKGIHISSFHILHSVRNKLLVSRVGFKNCVKTYPNPALSNFLNSKLQISSWYKFISKEDLC